MVINRRLIVMLMLMFVALLCLGADNGVNPQRRFDIIASNGGFIRLDTYTGKSWRLVIHQHGRRVWEPIYEQKETRTNGAGIVIRHGIDLFKNHRR